MKDDATPATKADIQRLYDAIERWKGEILSEVKQHFDVVVEQIRHDLLGANRDEIDVLKDRTNANESRILRLEVHAGI